MIPNQSRTFVAVAGNIGAGKSTLTQMLADHFGWQPFYEAHEENPYLKKFYKNMPRWSFHSQIYFLGKRLEHHRQLADYPGSVIQDRTVYEDAEVFARNLYKQDRMKKRDWDTYWGLYHAVSAFLPHPDLIIYLQASLDTLMRRIEARGRQMESKIPREYVAQLNRQYERWLEKWTNCPVMVVNMDMIDFQHDPDHFVNVCERTTEALHPGMIPLL
ncbi:MAG: deoxynucleoside kinase [Chloroflexi bacterium]|nr:deoxynucleoside kinase [Chloroflexota bacterium]